MEPVSLDCEFVTTSGGRDEVAQVCVVDRNQKTLLLSYVATQRVITDYKTRYSGIRPGDLEGAPSKDTVRLQVERLISRRLLIGHSVRNDLNILGIYHPRADIRDTSDLPKFLNRRGHKRKLRDLAEQFVGLRIQQFCHNPEEDAQAAMALYLGHWNLSGAAPLVELKCFSCGRPGHKRYSCPDSNRDAYDEYDAWFGPGGYLG